MSLEAFRRYMRVYVSSSAHLCLCDLRLKKQFVVCSEYTKPCISNSILLVRSRNQSPFENQAAVLADRMIHVQY
jgi:hypothetical protein